MKTYQHIIWDWNGTLLDDAWLCVELMNPQLAAQGLPQITLEDYAQVFRFPVKEYYREVGFDFSKTPFEALSDAFIAGYESRKLECPIRPEGVALIKRLSERGIPQSIISASEQTSLHAITRHYGVFDYFVSVRGLDNHHAHGKLDIGRAWLEELALPPDQVLMIGDTLHDCELARQLGIDCVLVFSGHQGRKRLKACGVPVYESLFEIQL
jgi:phosphoglycolate phosphatase